MTEDLTPEPTPCPRCNGNGWVIIRVPVGHLPYGQAQECPDCVNVSERAQARRLRYSGLPQVRHWTFANWETRPGTEKAWALMERFPDPAGPSMVTLCGLNGTGKSHLMQALGYRLLDQGVQVCYAFIPDLLEEVRSGYADASEVTAQAIYKRFSTAEVLLLDDLPDKRVTPFAVELIGRLVDERYREKKPLVLSTNLDSATAGRQDLWGARVADRLFAHSSPEVETVFLTCPSYRTGISWPTPNPR